MKRKGNIYSTIYSMDNLREAYELARKKKAKQKGVIEFEKNLEANLLALQQELIGKTYRTSEYKLKTIKEKKERLIAILPFVDRVAQHAIMIPVEPIIIPTFTANTYSSLKGRGIHAALNALKKILKDKAGTTYCLEMDVKKFYANIKHDIIKQLLRRKIKDKDLLWLLDSIIDSYADGLPIGNLLSQHFANLYLTPFDHWIKENLLVKNYLRYMDNMLVLHHDKKYLHQLRVKIQEYLRDNLKLELGNYQVFPIHPIKGRAADFVGYKVFHTHVKLRPRNKKALVRAVKRGNNKLSIASHVGWAKHGDCKNLLKKLGI